MRYLPLQVRPTPSVTLEAQPSDRAARHRASYDVTCRNTGNVPLEMDLAATDANHALTCVAEPPRKRSVS